MFGSLDFCTCGCHIECIFYLFTYSTDKLSYEVQAVLKHVVCLSPPYQTCLFCLKSAFLSVCFDLCIHLLQHLPPSSGVHPVPGPTMLRGPPSSRIHPARGPPSSSVHPGQVALPEHLCQVPQADFLSSSRDALPGLHPQPGPSQALSLLPSLLVSIWRKIFSVLFSGVDSSSGIFMTEDTIL